MARPSPPLARHRDGTRGIAAIENSVWWAIVAPVLAASPRRQDFHTLPGQAPASGHAALERMRLEYVGSTLMLHAARRWPPRSTTR